MNDTKYCTKCCTYASTEGATGTGRQYRCGSCAIARAKAAALAGGLARRVGVDDLKQRILEKAARTDGVAKKDIPDENKSTVSRTFDRMVSEDKTLYPVVIHKNWARYFSTQEGADAYRVIAQAQYDRQKRRLTQPSPIPTRNALDSWKRSDAVRPGHVELQVLPGFTGDRWQVQPPTTGFASLGIGRYLA
jgi:hypothetical protein